ncbi:MAG: hypothetical protein KF767_12940 [Bdellovibrionaceae bacterium]|nr:hypothetical protein [Pseudobdellovibrionaceae bacterium]
MTYQSAVLAILFAAAPALANLPAFPETIDFTPSDRPEYQGGVDFRTPVPNPDFNEIIGGGMTVPTIYFLPIINTETEQCDEPKLDLLLTSGAVAANLCARSLSFCSEQGTCILKADGEWRTYNVIRRVQGVDRFQDVRGACRFGFGVRSICLDPFYSVAADLSLYAPGDVLYIPALRDVLLPNGELHDGYVIVRDQGRGVKGSGRFDFFTGGMGWKDKKNPFVKLRFNAKGTGLPFHRVVGQVADLVRMKRAFPVLPWPNEGLVDANLAQENTAGTPTSALPSGMRAAAPVVATSPKIDWQAHSRSLPDLRRESIADMRAYIEEATRQGALLIRERNSALPEALIRSALPDARIQGAPATHQ